MNVHVPATAAASTVPRRIVDLAGGRTIALAQLGHGPDLIAIHGTLLTLEDMYLSCMPTLAQHFRVTAVDRPGHGLSRRKRLCDASPWRQAELIHQAAVAEGLQRPVLLGHSFGGSVALAYAAMYPDEVAGVLALAPMCLPQMRIEPLLFGARSPPAIGEAAAETARVFVDPALLPLLWNAMFLPQAMPRVMSEGYPFSLAGQQSQMIAEGEDAMALSPALFRLLGGYAACPVPVRILGGTADLVVNNAVQGLLAASLLRDGSFEWMPGCGHMIHHFEQAAVTSRSIAMQYSQGSTNI